MQTVDFSSMIVMYNLVIGILLMTSSKQVATFAGRFGGSYRSKVERFSHISTFAFGGVVTALSATIYIALHLLKLEI